MPYEIDRHVQPNTFNANTVPYTEGFEWWENTMKVHLPEK